MRRNKRRKVCRETEQLEKRKEAFRKIEESKANYFRIIDEINHSDGVCLYAYDDIRKEFLVGLSEDDHYVLLPRHYQFKHFNHKVLDGSKIFATNDFEDICAMVLSVGNLFDNLPLSYYYNSKHRTKSEDIRKMIRRNFKKSNLKTLLESHFDDIPKEYDRQIDYLFYKLARVPTDIEKRQLEKENIEKDIRSKKWVEMCKIDVPDDLIEIFFSYLDHKQFICTVGLVCEQFYLLFLKTWDRLIITNRNIYKIPTLAIWNAKIICFETHGILKSSFEYFIDNSLSVKELYLFGDKSYLFFVYIEKKKVIKKTITKITISKAGITRFWFKKDIFPNLKKALFSKFGGFWNITREHTLLIEQITSLGIHQTNSFEFLRKFKNLKTLKFYCPVFFSKNQNILYFRELKNLDKIEFNDCCLGDGRSLSIKKIIENEMETETVSIKIHFGQFKVTVNEDCVMFSEYLSKIDKLSSRCKHVHLKLIRLELNLKETLSDAKKLLNKLNFDSLPKNYKCVEKRVVEKFSYQTRRCFYILKYKFDRK